MNQRSAPRQGPPTNVDATFPACRPGRKTWFRAHNVLIGTPDGGCGHYSSVPPGSGRFDLPLPQGTCYLATSALAAARERLGRPGDYVAHDEVGNACVSRVRLTPGNLADLTHRDAATRGVTSELSASSPYRLTQAWAAAFAGAGFEGVRYRPRFSTEDVAAVAVFGAGGPQPFTVVSHRTVLEVLVAAGYHVLPAPDEAQLTML